MCPVFGAYASRLPRMVADGMTLEEILRAYPDLETEDIGEALQYVAEAVRERKLPYRYEVG